MEFDSTSNYMKYQRGKIRELEFKNKALMFTIFVMIIGFIWGGVKYFDLYDSYINSQDNVHSLQQMIKEKNDLIVDQEKRIEKLESRNKELEMKFYSTLKDKISEISGDTVAKAIGTVYLEATNQGEKGMQLVADTIWNRESSPKFKCDSVAEVLLYPTQFNVLTKVPTITEQQKNSEQYLLASKIVWDKILYDKTLSNDVLFFMNPSGSSGSSRGWFRTRHLVIKYKDHEFYS